MIQKIRALVSVNVGTRVLYDFPYPPDDFRGRAFFEKYNGKAAVICGFAKEYVGPLDSCGRMPGTYGDFEVVDVRFEGERKVHTMSVNHLLVLDACKTVAVEDFSRHAKISDLPRKIRFYTGDQVRKKDDPKKETRLVQRVNVADDAKITYMLGESAAEKQRRERKREEARNDRTKIPSVMLGIRQAERSDGKGLLLVSRGNVYNLYSAPEKLRFASDEEELLFWAQEGVSRQVSQGHGSMLTGSPLRGEFSLAEALEICERGEGDFVIASQRFPNLVVTGRKGDHQVRELHDCFGKYRKRVRALAKRVKTPPEEKNELSMPELARKVVGTR
jgi:hypothetical protein